MATILERKLKDGSTSYKIQVRVKNKGSGEVGTKTTTWRPDPTKSKKANERALQTYAVEFENEVRNDYEMGMPTKMTMTVETYSKIWLEHIKNDKSPTYYASCVLHMKDIVRELGGYKLTELTPPIIQRFIDTVNTAEYGEIEVTATNLKAERERQGMSKMRLSDLSGINTSTILKAERGGNIQYECAEAIAKALGKDITALFKVEDKAQSYSSSSKAKRYRTLRAMLGYALRQQYIDRNFATGDYIEPIKEINKPREFLDDVEIKELLTKLEDYDNRQAKAAIKTLIFTGLRRGELCGLEWEDIDLENRVMHIQRASKTVTGLGTITGPTKTQNSNRQLVMPNILVEELRDYKQWWDRFIFLLGDRYDGCRRLFLQADGTPLYPSTVRYWLKKMLKDFGMKDVCLHSLRHSNITIQLAAGVPIKTVSARAGHSSTKVTADIYAHMIKSSDREAADALDNILG